MEKNELISFKTTVVGKDKKGRDMLKLYLKGEDIDTFAKEFEIARKNPNGVRLSFHTSDKEYDGRTFKSTFAFVAGIQDRPNQAGAGDGARRAVPKSEPATDSNVGKTVV